MKIIPIINELYNKEPTHSDYEYIQQNLINIIRNNEFDPNEIVNNNTPLIYACSMSLEIIAIELINSGNSKPNHIGDNGDTALIICCMNKLVRVVVALIKTGKSLPSHVNNDGDNALIIACCGINREITLELIKTGQSNPGHITPDGLTVLFCAIMNSLEDISIELLKTGEARPEHTFDGKTAIDYIKREEMPRLYEYVFENYRYYPLLKPETIDDTYNKFDRMMQMFEGKKNTILHKSGYIKDAILDGQDNPYLVHYEEFGGEMYPIITILKGTLLFTGRVNRGNNLLESYYHLYKLFNHPTLDEYIKENCKDSLTYFFPSPSVSHHVNAEYTTMDMVVLTKDIRLICLISPSPLNRDIRENRDNYVDTNHSIYYDNNYNLTACKTRRYDTCISNDLLISLKLNGYIAIAFEDSLTKHIVIDKDNKYKSMLIYLSSCFNNGIYTRQDKIVGNNFIEKMTDSRTYGIPEIVIVPYDLHMYSDPNEYANVYNEWTTKLIQNTYITSLDDSHFIFKYIAHANADNSIELGKNMGELLRQYDGITKPSLDKSLQSYPLFTVLSDYVDPRNRDYILGNRDITFDDVAFVNSYMRPSKSKSAFETNIFYEMLSNPTTGGSVSIMKPTNIINKNMSSISRIEKNKQIYEKQKINFNIRNRKPIQFENKYMYYNEANGIPIVVYKTNSVYEKTGGTNNKSKKRSRKQKRKLRQKRKTRRYRR